MCTRSTPRPLPPWRAPPPPRKYCADTTCPLSERPARCPLSPLLPHFGVVQFLGKNSRSLTPFSSFSLQGTFLTSTCQNRNSSTSKSKQHNCALTSRRGAGWGDFQGGGVCRPHPCALRAASKRSPHLLSSSSGKLAISPLLSSPFHSAWHILEKYLSECMTDDS